MSGAGNVIYRRNSNMTSVRLFDHCFGYGSYSSWQSPVVSETASRRRKPCTARCAVSIAGVSLCRIPVPRPNGSVRTKPANGPEKRSGNATKWPLIRITGPTNATANSAGNASIPSTGARIVNSGRITANGTGCCNSTETTNVEPVRLQRWTCQEL